MKTALLRFARIPRRLIVNPLAMVLLLVLIAFELDGIRGYDGLRHRSSLALLLRWEDPLPEAALASHRSIYIVRDNGDWRFMEPDRESWDEASRVLTDRPEDVITAAYAHTSVDRGLIHPTRRIGSHTLELEVEFGGAFTPAQLAAAGRSIATHLGLDDHVATRLQRAADTGTADVRTSGILPRGYLLNIYLALLLAGFIYSLWWLPAAANRIRRWRRGRALARGRCPQCGYNMQGAESDRGGVCPECGTQSAGKPPP